MPGGACKTVFYLLSILSIAGVMLPSSLHVLNLANNQLPSTPKGENIKNRVSSLHISLSVIIL